VVHEGGEALGDGEPAALFCGGELGGELIRDRRLGTILGIRRRGYRSLRGGTIRGRRRWWFGRIGEVPCLDAYSTL